MERYIDVGALGIGRAKRELFTIPEYADGWNDAIKIIENAPTADVAPRELYEYVKNSFDTFVSQCNEYTQDVVRAIFADLAQYGICEQLNMGGVCLTEQEFEELKKKYGVE